DSDVGGPHTCVGQLGITGNPVRTPCVGLSGDTQSNGLPVTLEGIQSA
ncbi:MAG: hypothetical protein RLZ55_1249, partial [Actinomycetota bacterium]